jgi:UDP-N-acetylmuramoyl-L-alanyl-D-glutamate--2,6-diaminopimelate ligase
VAVVNSDDPFGARLLRKLGSDRPDVRTVTFGLDPRAQVRAEDVLLGLHESRLRVVWPEGAVDFAGPLVGSDQVANLLAAVAAAWAMGRDPEVFLADGTDALGAPGRMERIEEGQPFAAFVDRARSENELRRALATLRPLTRGNLRVVFGCDAESGAAERAAVARAVQSLADSAIATANNPGSVDVEEIFKDLRAGVTAPARISFIGDRREALAAALESCEPGDCLLVAGKGHEATQEQGGAVFPFDDRAVVRELLQAAAVPA